MPDRSAHQGQSSKRQGYAGDRVRAEKFTGSTAVVDRCRHRSDSDNTNGGFFDYLSICFHKDRLGFFDKLSADDDSMDCQCLIDLWYDCLGIGIIDGWFHAPQHRSAGRLAESRGNHQGKAGCRGGGEMQDEAISLPAREDDATDKSTLQRRLWPAFDSRWPSAVGDSISIGDGGTSTDYYYADSGQLDGTAESIGIRLDVLYRHPDFPDADLSEIR